MAKTPDYLLQIKVKNAPMMRAMKAAGFETASSLARAAGLSPTRVGEFLNLKKAPITKDGEWAEAAKRIAAALQVVPAVLFPAHHLREPLKNNKGEFEASLSDVRAFVTRGAGATPLEKIEGDQLSAAIAALIDASLSETDKEILVLRYGLNGEEQHTYRQIGRRLGVAGERVRQRELRALRKLKSKNKYEKNFLERHGAFDFLASQNQHVSVKEILYEDGR